VKVPACAAPTIPRIAQKDASENIGLRIIFGTIANEFRDSPFWTIALAKRK
jgi:hypothetical protein